MRVNPELTAVAIGTGALTERRKSISETILDLTGKEKPSILAISTAKSSPERTESFHQSFTSHFADLLGVKVDFLHEYQTPPSSDELAHKVGQADAIYVSGGNTLRMMEFWAKHGIDSALQAAIRQGKVMSGGSAGAIAWFNTGHSDSLSFEVTEGEPWDYIFVEGLGAIDAGVCPHYNARTEGGKLRKISLKDMMIEDSTVPEDFIGIDNDAGLVVVRGLVSVTRCSDKGRVYHIQRSVDGVVETELDMGEPIPAVSIG